MLQEDGTPWQGMILGREGRASFNLAIDGTENDFGFYTAIENALVMSWYKMQSGRWEVVAYIS